VVFISRSFVAKRYAIAEVETDCPVCHVRFVHGTPVAAYTCDGNFLRINGEDCFREPGTLRAREYAFGGQVEVETTTAYRQHR
jgi:hypothetical protein